MRRRCIDPVIRQYGDVRERMIVDLMKGPTQRGRKESVETTDIILYVCGAALTVSPWACASGFVSNPPASITAFMALSRSMTPL